jgi:hypothetical protein
VSEFALEYRTTRERVLQQLEKKANHRERNKTRGKMITDVRLAMQIGKSVRLCRPHPAVSIFLNYSLNSWQK